jgi:L-aspartate oxidase
LLSEALRGEGALLLNPSRERFMQRYHPMAELAPRDVVARAIVQEIAASKLKSPVAYLDLRHLDAPLLRARFPRIYSTCKEFGIDITRDLVPVRPAAHYLMGGIKTDLDGRTSLAGLYAAGETACTGVHGANRLASNSLLEGLVFGARVANVMRNEGRSGSQTSCSDASNQSSSSPLDPGNTVKLLQQAMWQYAGVIRNREGLESLKNQILEWKHSLENVSERRTVEASNLLSVGELITRSALAREESRGAHFRADFPKHDDARFLKHSVVRGEDIHFE